MLEYTLATDFVPGTNVKGEVSGANWTFLLPSLALGQVVCWGAPAPWARQALERLGDTLTICADGDAAGPSDAAADTAVTWLACDSQAPWPFADASVDLVYLARAAGLRRLLRDAPFRGELARVLAPHGRVYAEQWGQSSPRGEWPGDEFAPPQRLWLTPLTGEMHTAVPVEDSLTQRYFLQRGLFSPSVTVHALKGAAKRLRAQFGGAARARRTHVTGETDSSERDEAGQPGVANLMRRAGRVTLEGITRVEELLHGQSGRVGRYGLLVSRAGATHDPAPPAYLRELARDGGVDLAGYRWGLWAGGQYSSRKVLFFLFEGDAATPQYLVKMVRAAQFNARLENEARALPLLAALGVDNHVGLAPRLVFEGHHHGLALVGETVIEGVPLEQRATLAPDCPALVSAVEWLTSVGAVSARSNRVAPSEAARVTHELLDRFRSVYDLSEEQHNFLAGQIATLRSGADDFPVVFQHGDPGTWNMLVTPDDRVAVLDWESAEPNGMPLWDLFYFLRAYVVMAARAGGESDRLRAYSQHFVDWSSFSAAVVAATQRYCEQVGLAPQYVEPLYYTCWMHRALKQATTLPPGQLQEGYYFRLLKQSIERRDAPTLTQLFTL